MDTINNKAVKMKTVWDHGPPSNLQWNRKFVAGKSITGTRVPYQRPQYYSAGVLPYSWDAGGNLVFLLGKDREGNWSDFGGRSEQQDYQNHVKTASRELYEETLGAVMNMDSAQRMLSQPSYSEKRGVINSKTLGGSPYYMYFLEIQYADYKKNFKRIYDYMKYIGQKFLEKIDIRWVSSETLLAAVDEELKNSNVLVPLRPIFRTTILDHIEEIKNIGIANPHCQTHS